MVKSHALVGFVALLFICDAKAFGYYPMLNSNYDWNRHHPLTYRQMDSIFDDMMLDFYNFGYLPHSWITPYQKSNCQYLPETQTDDGISPHQGQIDNQDQHRLKEEQQHQAKIAQLEEETIRRAKQRDEYDRLVREAEEQIQALERDSEYSNNNQRNLQRDVQQDDQARIKQARAEQARAEQARAEQARAEQARVKQVRAEQARAEQARIKQAREQEERLRQQRARQESAWRAEQKRREMVQNEKFNQRNLENEKVEKLNDERGHTVQDGEQRMKPQSHRPYYAIAQHMAPGYHPDDLNVKVKDDRILVSGNHICTCLEDCITKEFSRSYPLPSHIDPSSLQASVDNRGKITISGARKSGRQIQQSDGVDIRVTGDGHFEKPSPEELRKCLHNKGGIKLNKVNRKTGRTVELKENEPQLVTESHQDLDELDDDDTGFSTIEVEY